MPLMARPCGSASAGNRSNMPATKKPGQRRKRTEHEPDHTARCNPDTRAVTAAIRSDEVSAEAAMATGRTRTE